MKKIILLLFVLLFAISLGNFMGCASSKPKEQPDKTEAEGDMGEIEKLLGITPEDKEKAETKNASEDDLLTLLKADENKGAAPTATEAGAGDPRLLSLQSQVESLEKELTEKNRQIADLKTQLMMKDEELKKYQTGAMAAGAVGAAAVSEQQPPTAPRQPQEMAAGQEGEGARIYVAQEDYEATYQEGLNLFREGQYKDAIDIFEALLQQDRTHSLADNAQYWIGECHYAMGNYRAALLAFEKVFTFPQSNKNDYAQFKLGLTYLKMGDPDRAEEEFQNLIDNYSNDELIQKAENILFQMNK